MNEYTVIVEPYHIHWYEVPFMINDSQIETLRGLNPREVERWFEQRDGMRRFPEVEWLENIIDLTTVVKVKYCETILGTFFMPWWMRKQFILEYLDNELVERIEEQDSDDVLLISCFDIISGY